MNTKLFLRGRKQRKETSITVCIEHELNMQLLLEVQIDLTIDVPTKPTKDDIMITKTQ